MSYKGSLIIVSNDLMPSVLHSSIRLCMYLTVIIYLFISISIIQFN